MFYIVVTITKSCSETYVLLYSHCNFGQSSLIFLQNLWQNVMDKKKLSFWLFSTWAWAATLGDCESGGCFYYVELFFDKL